MFVLFIFVIVLFVGLGIDLGFAYITKASLSKAVDSACLAGLRNLSQGTITAGAVADSTFHANYGSPGRDTGPVTPNINFGTDASGNTILDVDATATINTFFLRILPQWRTLTVSASAQTTRTKLVLSLVLDRSGSMGSNGGADALPGAVDTFINMFDDTNDRASMSSFASGSTVDVPMGQPFKSAISAKVHAMSPGGVTCAERGLTNGLAQIDSVTVSPGEVKVIVFFSDGMANTWYYPSFNCGPQDIDYMGGLHDPVTGDSPGGHCTVPSTLPSINGGPDVDTRSCVQMHNEAQERAEWIAHIARDQGIIVYAIGMGDPNSAGECNGAFPVLNPEFLKDLANTPDSATYDPTQPVGDYAIAANAGELDHVFQMIAAKILLRLTAGHRSGICLHHQGQSLQSG
jgi:Flp pilus assembly protein TadG